MNLAVQNIAKIILNSNIRKIKIISINYRCWVRKWHSINYPKHNIYHNHKYCINTCHICHNLVCEFHYQIINPITKKIICAICSKNKPINCDHYHDDDGKRKKLMCNKCGIILCASDYLKHKHN